jgi:hypothetical protein
MWPNFRRSQETISDGELELHGPPGFGAGLGEGGPGAGAGAPGAVKTCVEVQPDVVSPSVVRARQ